MSRLRDTLRSDQCFKIVHKSLSRISRESGTITRGSATRTAARFYDYIPGARKVAFSLMAGFDNGSLARDGGLTFWCLRWRPIYAAVNWDIPGRTTWTDTR